MTQDKNISVSYFDYNNDTNVFERKSKDIETGFTEKDIIFDNYLSEDKCTRYWVFE